MLTYRISTQALIGAMGLALLGAVPAGAQEATSDRAALERALASVNEGGRDYQPLPSTRREGFFGRGFQVYSDSVGEDFGGDRVGGRPVSPATEGEAARGARGETILLRR